MSTSHGLETPDMIDEYDASTHEMAEFMSKEEAAKYRRTAAKLNYFHSTISLLLSRQKRLQGL